MTTASPFAPWICSIPRLLQRQGKGELVGDYFADIVVEDRIILELKSIEKLQPVHEAQLLNYLKATGMQVGLLINFTHPKAEIKRMVFNLPGGHDTTVCVSQRGSAAKQGY